MKGAIRRNSSGVKRRERLLTAKEAKVDAKAAWSRRPSEKLLTVTKAKGT
jgi:hypothetical protein